jgi:Uri superfamily endonuclease
MKRMENFVGIEEEAPPAPGAYALLVRLVEPISVRAGGREMTLAPGRYLYCGSARGPGGLRARLARHMRRSKKAHWHIDQLTTIGNVEGAFVELGGDECAIARRLAHLPAPCPGFGASDCRRCVSHLFLLPDGAALPSAMERARKGDNSSKVASVDRYLAEA